MAKAATPAPTPIPDEAYPQYIVHDSKVWRVMRAAGFYGYVPCDVPTQPPWMEWEGGRITLTVWSQILAFFEWSQKEFKSEVQVRLYYNRTTKKWAPWAYPQRPNGMTTNEIADHADVPAQRAQFPDPWMLLGTVHHHCTSGAFQSSVDRNNEETQEGVHITVGKIGSAEYDLHGRVVVKGSHYACSWCDWFEMPVVADADLPPKIRDLILDFYLKRPPADTVAFPETWKTNCKKFETTYVALSPNHGGIVNIGRNEVPFVNDVRTQFCESEIEFMKDAQALMDQSKISHTRLDTIVCATSSTEMLGADDKKLVAIVTEYADKHKVSRQRMDQMLDCWDFAVVLGEINRLNKELDTKVKNVLPAKIAVTTP